MTIDLPAKGKRPRRSHIFDRDDHDFYVEPAWCSERLFAVEPFAGLIWDPAAGSGTIPRPHGQRACRISQVTLPTMAAGRARIF